jgi:hypothetical protein
MSKLFIVVEWTWIYYPKVLAKGKLLHTYIRNLRLRENYLPILLFVVILEMMPSCSAFQMYME